MRAGAGRRPGLRRTPGDGRPDALAQRNGSVISATLFGAVAGSGVLPFPREAFEAAIERGGVGVVASRKAFAAAFDQAQGRAAPSPPLQRPSPRRRRAPPRPCVSV